MTSTFSFTQKSSNQLLEHIQVQLKQIDSLLLIENFEQALTRIENIESYKNYISNTKNKLELDFKKAQLFFWTNKHQKGMRILLDNFNKIDPEKNANQYAKYTKYLGSIFNAESNYKRSLYYYKLRLLNANKQQDTVTILDSYLEIGKVYFEKEQLDSANFYNLKIIEFPVNSKTNDIVARAYNNLGVFAGEIQDFELAEAYGKKFLEIRKSQKNQIETAQALSNLSGVYFEKKDFKSSEEYYLEALNMLRDKNTQQAIKVTNNLLYNLSYVSEEQKNYKKAYKYLVEATFLTDSLTNTNTLKNISEIEAKYNVEKQARIAEEEKSKRLRAQILFYIAATVFIALIILGYIFYRNYRLKQQTKLDQLEHKTQTKIINATIDAKEMERKSIAEILHDSVSALLSSANLHLQATKAQLREKAPYEITKAQRIVNEASVKIRDLSHELISSVLLKFGLAFAVHDMCQKYSNSEINIHSNDVGIKRYQQDFEIKIHNIVEELINNILKHSKASNASIMLAQKEDGKTLSIRISDDGVGFNPKAVRGKNGLGLSHIEARIKVMKGVFNIISSKEEGTSIFITVPIQFKE